MIGPADIFLSELTTYSWSAFWSVQFSGCMQIWKCIYVKTCHDTLYTILQEQDITPLCVLLCHQIAGTFNISCNIFSFLAVRCRVLSARSYLVLPGFQFSHWHIEDGWRRFAFLHYNCARRMTQICVSNTRLFSLHNTLNYATHRACLRMVLLTDVYRNLTSLWIKL